MRPYITFFKMRILNGLQYRSAAYAGIFTQLAWGIMTILMFRAFYISNPTGFPMTFSQLTSYIWLQQALLSIFMSWFFDNAIFDSITNGNVSYEICRPIGLYEMWFTKTLSDRLSRAFMRGIPILIIAAFLPSPYGISLPADASVFFLFLLSTILSALLMASINMMIYIISFYTLSSMGIRILSMSLIEFFSGSIIPIPFLPNKLQKIFNLLPFASTQNTPFLIYNGFLFRADVYPYLLIQIFWLVFFVVLGKLLIKKALKQIVLQGG